jgi:16S rRNA (uracil1498-N3)-methyltransferase
MRQYYLPEQDLLENQIEVKGKDYHYLKNVLRLKAGDIFTGINRKGDNFKLTILEEKRNSLLLKAEKISEKAEKRSFKIHLYQCLPKAAKMDLIVRQAAETGVEKIIPVISNNTIAKPNEKKAERWRRIIREAVQQSGTSIYTEIENPLSFKKLNNLSEGIKLFFHQKSLSENSLFSYLQIGYKKGNLNKINILIGPEGGFTDKEVKELIYFGFKPVYLGSEVLRAETAALYAIASVKTLLFELNYQEDKI